MQDVGRSVEGRVSGFSTAGVLRQAMSSRRFVAQVITLISVNCLVGAALLQTGACVLLDLGPQTRWAELIKIAVYVLVCIAGLNALVLAQLRGVLRLLRTWDRGQMAGEEVLRRAQQQALTFPDRFSGQVFLLAWVVVATSVYVDVKLSGYQLAPVLINGVLTIALLLAVGFVINVGLRSFLHTILVRIPLLPLPGWKSFSVGRRITLVVLLTVSIALISAGAFVYSYVIKGMDELAAQERLDRLETAVVPALLESDLDELAAYARPGEELFLLTRSARYLEHPPTRLLTDYEMQLLAQAQSPLRYKRDYSSLRLVAFPVDHERVLGLVYDSPAMQSGTIREARRVYLVLALVVLVFATVVGTRLGHDLLRTLGYVTERMEALADQTQTSETILAHPSLDEMGELVGAFNRVQQRTAEYTAQLQASVEALEQANAQRQRLVDTMVGLTAPVIPVRQGVAVVLLSGYFDEERAAYIRPNLVQGVTQARARVVIVDLTAVAQVSTPLIAQLGAAVRTLLLMGCQVVLTGAGPELAWALSLVGGELINLPARRRLEDGLDFAYNQLGVN